MTSQEIHERYAKKIKRDLLLRMTLSVAGIILILLLLFLPTFKATIDVSKLSAEDKLAMTGELLEDVPLDKLLMMSEEDYTKLLEKHMVQKYSLFDEIKVAIRSFSNLSLEDAEDDGDAISGLLSFIISVGVVCSLLSLVLAIIAAISMIISSITSYFDDQTIILEYNSITNEGDTKNFKSDRFVFVSQILSSGISLTAILVIKKIFTSVLSSAEEELGIWYTDLIMRADGVLVGTVVLLVTLWIALKVFSVYCSKYRKSIQSQILTDKYDAQA